MEVAAGTTSFITHIEVKDSSSTTGAGLADLVYNSANLVCYYIRAGEASPTQITLASATVGTWTSGGFVEVDDTSLNGEMPAVYEVGIPDAVLAAGASSAVVMWHGATNMMPVLMRFTITA